MSVDSMLSFGEFLYVRASCMGSTAFLSGGLDFVGMCVP
jgi:hypothetical protein